MTNPTLADDLRDFARLTVVRAELARARETIKRLEYALRCALEYRS